MYPDITMCSPTKLMKKCKDCYRRTVKPDKWQSYANLYDECKSTNYSYYLENKL